MARENMKSQIVAHKITGHKIEVYGSKQIQQAVKT
jgi:hypothetical protein